MKKLLLAFMGILVFSVFSFKVTNAQDAATGALIDQLVQSSQIQKDTIISQNIGKRIIGGGTVADVKDYDTFDETTNTKATYYEVMTDVQNTNAGNPYQVIFFYKNKDDALKFNRGERLVLEGSVLKIFDNRLWMELWLFPGELGPQEQTMFSERATLPEIPKKE